ncbi:Glutathione S-transferase, N-terminal domain [Tyrophagus putrescentiae]|nr:Glutathione S-transferase, N-terminal domain [Tyrophagus putrescentiae]
MGTTAEFDLYYNVLSPPARAVAVLVKHLQLKSVNFIEVDVHSGYLKTPEFLKLNPRHTIPTIVDHGFALFESRAILAYLVNKYAPGSSLYPNDPVSRAKVDKVLFFDAAGFFPSLKDVLLSKYRHEVEPSPEAIAELTDKVSVLETLLESEPFLAGNQLTIADLSVGASYLFLQALKLSSSKLDDWYGRIGLEVPVFAEMSAQAVEIFKKKN